MARISSGRALGERATLVEHVDPVADVHDQRHVVIDQQHARLVVVAHRADDRREFGHLRLGQTRGRLVEQHEARLGGERAGDAESPLVTVSEGRRRRGGAMLQPEEVEQLVGPLSGDPRAGTDAERGELDVLAHREASKRAAVLERACDARPGRGGAAPSA